MTPEEAIEIIEKQIVTCEAMIEFNENFDPEEDNTKFLKEKEALLMAVQSIREVQQYRAIGTVEECREAREKQIPKPPIMKPYYEDMPDEEYLCCPTCGDILTDRIPDDNKNFYFHCLNCGQKFDWSDEDD